MSENCKGCKLFKPRDGVPEYHRNGRGDCHLLPRGTRVHDNHFCKSWASKVKPAMTSQEQLIWAAVFAKNFDPASRRFSWSSEKACEDWTKSHTEFAAQMASEAIDTLRQFRDAIIEDCGDSALSKQLGEMVGGP